MFFCDVLLIFLARTNRFPATNIIHLRWMYSFLDFTRISCTIRCLCASDFFLFSSFKICLTSIESKSNPYMDIPSVQADYGEALGGKSTLACFYSTLFDSMIKIIFNSIQYNTNNSFFLQLVLSLNLLNQKLNSQYLFTSWQCDSAFVEQSK